MSMLDQLSAANLWVKVIEQTRRDLTSSDSYLVLAAARYFFIEPVSGDDRDIQTFAGLCTVTNINADAAAKAIFEKLCLCQQKKILYLLREVDFEGIRSEVIM